jgi:hypothetical protein
MNEIISAYEQGVDDGFFRGIENDPYVGDELRAAYRRGYDHGVWMHCETLEDPTDYIGMGWVDSDREAMR